MAHFHVPKPLHGWREFVGEVGIIVLGVLIALGAEQFIEGLHWRHEVAAERASLRQEATDSFGTVAVREGQQSCIDRRLAEVQTVLYRHHRGEALGITGKVETPFLVTATRGTWQIALSGQALSHMSNEEKLKWSDLFLGFDRWDESAKQEADLWLGLQPLDHAELLTEQDWSGVRSAYANAEAFNDRLKIIAPFMLRKARDLGFGPKPGASIAGAGLNKIAQQICQPLLSSERQR